MPSEARSDDGARTTFNLHLLEHRIRVECDDRGFLGHLARCFEASPDDHAHSPGESVDLCLRLTTVKTGLEITSDPLGAFEGIGVVYTDEPTSLASALTLWAVQETRQYYVFHAGAVARDKRAILLPAPSHHGKSTLTAALLGRGFDLLSDEAAAIDMPTGRLIGYPRALWLRPESLAVLGLDPSLGTHLDGDHRIVSAAALGARRAAGKPRPALVVCPRFRTGEPTRLERLRAGPAVMALMRSSCSQPRFKVEGLDFVIDLARRTPCYRLTYSDAREAASAIEDLFAAGSPRQRSGA